MTTKEAAEFALKALHEAKFEAYLVGGCVRDLIIGREPKDWDITTNATPEQVKPLFEKTIPVGAQFGVIVAVIDGIQIEIATYRSDGSYSDGRRPDSVIYSKSIKEDIIRRDFTMNGLLIPYTHAPIKNDGYHLGWVDDDSNEALNTIVDYVDGLHDIRHRIICCIGDPNKRFEEDALRMLRAVRFAAQLDFDIEPDTYKAIVVNASSIKNVSRERIAQELFKLVSSPFPVKGLVLLATTGLLQRILYELNSEFVLSMPFAYTLQRFSMFPTTDPILGMAMLLADNVLGISRICGMLKLSNEQRALIEGAFYNFRNLKDVRNMELAEFKELIRKPGMLPYGVALFEQSIAAGIIHMGDEAGMSIVSDARAFTPEELHPTPLITGDDLIAMGLKPSRRFAKILSAVEHQQLNGELKNKEEAITFISDKFASSFLDTYSACLESIPALSHWE